MNNLKTIITLFMLVLITSCSKDSDAPATPDATIVNLAITNISSITGPKNTPVTITGAGFSTTASNNIVTLNGKVCIVNQANATQLNITIPAKSTTGNFIVTVGSINAQSAVFTYIDTATVSTFAGSTRGFADGVGTTAKFDNLFGITIDLAGNLYVADSGNNRIRKITPTGAVTTFAGSGASGSADGTGTTAQLILPRDVVFDKTTNNFFVVSGQKIRKITTGAVVTTLAGSTQGFADGTGSSAQFSDPRGITIDPAGNVFVADLGNDKIRKITPTSVVTTIAGSTSGFTDGTGTSALFHIPAFITSDAIGNLFVSDSFNHKIRKITPTGAVSTIAGSTQGFADDVALNAKFSSPQGVAFDANGNLFICDFNNHAIRKISQTGKVSTIAGDIAGFSDGIGIAAKFNLPNGITIDNDGILYVTDRANNKIRKIVID